MKNYIYFLLLLLSISYANSQGTAQNADGKSSLLFKGSAITFDLGKTALGFSWSNLNNVVADNSSGFFGINASAKNEEGFGGLFSSGILVPSGALNGFAGWTISNGTVPWMVKISNDLNNRMSVIVDEIQKYFNEKMKLIIEDNIKDTEINDLIKLKKDLLKNIENDDKLDSILKVADTDSAKMKEIKEKFSKKRKELKIELQKRQIEMTEELQKKYDRLDTIHDSKPFWQIYFFGFGGINAMNFKQVKQVDTTNLTKSFENIYFRGGKAGLGFNAQYGFVTLGMTYSYSSVNNFDLLSKKEYTFRQTKNSGTQSLIEEKKITAYSGTYGSVEVNELNVDLIFNFKLDAKASNHILINPYIRSQLFSRNENILPNKLDIGCGFYFFKQDGNFLGGLYAELPDVNNNYEKAKPIEEQNIREPLKRLSFGIVGKYSFNSLLGSF